MKMKILSMETRSR